MCEGIDIKCESEECVKKFIKPICSNCGKELIIGRVHNMFVDDSFTLQDTAIVNQSSEKKFRNAKLKIGNKIIDVKLFLEPYLENEELKQKVAQDVIGILIPRTSHIFKLSEYKDIIVNIKENEQS